LRRRARAGQSVIGTAIGAAGSQKGSQSESSGSHDASHNGRRGQGEDSIYWDATKNRYIGAVSLGFSPSGTRIRKKVVGRTKTEVRDKLKELHRQVESGRRPKRRYTVGDALDDWLEDAEVAASPACPASTAIPPRPDSGWARSARRTWNSPARNQGCSRAFALPQQHRYGAPDDGTGQDRTPLGQLRTALDELVDAGVLRQQRRDGIEYPIWSAVHGLAVLAGQGPLRDIPDATRHHLEELTFTLIGEGLT
jgi:hypothetical protein